MSKEKLLKEDDNQKSELANFLSSFNKDSDKSIITAIFELVEKGQCTKGDIIEFFVNHELLSNFNNDDHYYDYGNIIINASLG